MHTILSNKEEIPVQLEWEHTQRIIPTSRLKGTGRLRRNSHPPVTFHILSSDCDTLRPLLDSSRDVKLGTRWMISHSVSSVECVWNQLRQSGIKSRDHSL
jgi:hypothetical protein